MAMVLPQSISSQYIYPLLQRLWDCEHTAFSTVLNTGKNVISRVAGSGARGHRHPSRWEAGAVGQGTTARSLGVAPQKSVAVDAWVRLRPRDGSCVEKRESAWATARLGSIA